MGLTIKKENDFGSMFDKFASLPDDVKKNVDRVNDADKKSKTKDSKKD